MIDNDSGVSLPPGIITVYDGQQGYVGDAQTKGVPFGEKQAVSFALDQKVTITSEPHSQTTITQIKVIDGMINTSSVTREDTVYRIRGASDAPRTVLIELSKRPGWTFKAGDMIDGTPTKDRMKTVLKTGETKSVTSSLSIVNEESFCIGRCWFGCFATVAGCCDRPCDAGKTCRPHEGQGNAGFGKQSAGASGPAFQRGEADQQRARSNLQSVGNGDTKARFEKLLNSAEQTRKHRAGTDCSTQSH